MRSWELFVEAYHVLIAKLVMLDAYAIFTNSLMEDRIYLPGTGTVGGSRLLQHQGARYQPLGG
jgi:hypothetical protein